MSVLEVARLQTWGKGLSSSLKCCTGCEAQVAGEKDGMLLSALSEKTTRQVDTPSLSRGRRGGTSKRAVTHHGHPTPKSPKTDKQRCQLRQHRIQTHRNN